MRAPCLLTPKSAVLSSLAVLFALLPGVVVANGPGDPTPDVNIVGPTKDPNDIRDEGLKQQNEPACAMRVGDSDCIICFYNDYRTVDIAGHEDAWIGMSESCDAGYTWTSRATPGSPSHPAPLGTKFAADPRVVAIPGMAIHGFISGFRDSDEGVIAVQHWLPVNKDDFDFNEPTLATTVVEPGTEGRFIDKGELHAVLDEGSRQGTVTLSFTMENPALGTITRNFPSGTLYAAFAEFTGSQASRLVVKRSYDWGKSWPNKSVKITESQNKVSGITMTSLNGITMAMWRQVNDVNDNDAMFYSFTTNGGNSWAKPILLRDVCRFDQPSATLLSPPQVTFRTNDFPWLATDGSYIYAFYSERQGSCLTGTPKIVMQYTADGTTWSAPVPVVNNAAEPDAINGAQFMPAAFGARGKVQIAWYDTRRENVPVDGSQPFIADYVPAPGVRVNRKVDVYTARVSVDPASGVPEVSESVRVSRYRSVGFANGGPLFEIEASFGNAMMFRDGFLSFIGDYIAVTAEEFRPDGSGRYEPNYSPVPGASNLVDFFIAYADNRNVFGDVLFGDAPPASPYTPPDNVAAGAAAGVAEPGEAPGEEAMLASVPDETAAGEGAARTGTTEGLDDVFTNPTTECVPGADRTRDANIYGSLVRDRLRLSSPVESRPLSGILRAIPFVARDVTTDPADPPVATPYRLYIANQPPDFPLTGRASFRQKPDRGPFTGAPPPVLIEDIEIPTNGALARTIFLVSADISASVNVNIYDGACATAADLSGPGEFATACPVLGSIRLGGAGSAGPLQQPDYLSTQCAANPQDCDVSVTELHNPLLENPLLENPLLENPLLENPLLENPLLENPLLENFGFEAPLLENPLLENPLLENIVVENPLLENPLLENPLLENPLLENSAGDGSSVTWVDITAVVRNDGNVTTAYNFDATAANFQSTAGGEPVSQLILWKQYAYATSRDCIYRPVAEQQVIATINQPDNTLDSATIDDPFAGEATMILTPGERGFMTYRMFGTPAELEDVRLKSFTASSQAANCDEFDDEFGPPAGGGEFYACEDGILVDQELILVQADTTGPTFDGLTENQVIPVPAVEANAPGGACLDPVASGLVSASDDSPGPIDILCTNSEGDAICLAAGDTGLSVPVSNTVANPGPSALTCVATDESGNSTSINLFLDVVDTAAPFFTSVPLNPTTVNADAVTGTAIANLENGLAGEDADGVDPNPVIGCATDTGLETGDPLPIGNNNVDCRITDASGNFSTYSYVIDVLDVTPPDFATIPIDIVISASASGDAVVTFSVPDAVDNGGTPVVTCEPPSGSIFPVGTTSVTCTATDAAGNASQVTFDVIVEDTTAPVIVLNGQNPLALEVGSAYVEAGAAATDNVDGMVAVNIAGAVDTATPGTYAISYSATDAAGNVALATRTVVVSDTTAPTMSGVPGTITVNAESAAGTVVDYTAPTATDLSAGGASVACTPVSGALFAVGTTTVVCTAADGSGNTATASFDVVVADMTAPVLTVSPDPFIAFIQGPSGATVNYAGAISVSDAVDPAPAYVCTPPSGSLFAPGDTAVSCTATDASGNSSTTGFTVSVRYAGGTGITPNKLTDKAGSSNPLAWAWRDEAGNNVDSSADAQYLRIVDCNNPAIVILQMAGDPGSSGFRFKTDLSWEYNWQSKDAAGNPLPNGRYCASVESGLTGQRLTSPPIRLR